MRAFLLAFSGAGFAMLVVVAFLVGRSLGPDSGFHASSDSGEDFWRVTFEVATGPRGEDSTTLPGLARSDEFESVPHAPRADALPEQSPGLSAQARVKEESVPERETRRSGSIQHDRTTLAVIEPATPPDRIDGPVTESWYNSEQLAYQGTQIPTKDQGWVREGSWKAWHENGQLHELGDYRGGVEHGPWKWWYANGRPMAEGRFGDGRRLGEWTFWYESGGLQMRGAYVEDLGAGRWTHWHENGLVRAEGNMRAGKLSGAWKVWCEDGSVDREATGVYENGEKVGD